LNFFKKILTLILLFFTCFPAITRADALQEDRFFIGVQAGLNSVQGYFKNEIGDGYNAGIFAGYQPKSRYLIFTGDFLYHKFSLNESQSSEFSVMTAGAGGSFFYPFKYINPYAGLLATINYIELNAVMSGKKERTVKPGLLLQTGIYIPVGNILLNTGIMYSVNELSKKLLQDTGFSIGISYSFAFVPGDKYRNAAQEIETTVKKIDSVNKQLETDKDYETGKKYFDQGDGFQAREYFYKVISADKNYKDTEKFISSINDNEKIYRDSLDLIKEGKFFDALVLLKESSVYLIEASKELENLRLQMKTSEKKLENQGIKAYEEEDYENCILIMNKILLINPENEAVKIYLPRAEKRYDALRKFK
jgi:hypothetical protein